MDKKLIEKRLKKLNDETNQIFDELKSLSDENIVKHGKGWSIVQVLNHLNMAESLSLNYMKKKVNAGKKMKKINVVNRLRIWITCGFLDTGLKWKAPKYIANPPNQMTLKEQREAWEKTRLEIADYINQYPEELLDRAVYKHPMAGRLSLSQAINSFIFHQRHHVYQIKRIRKELSI